MRAKDLEALTEPILVSFVVKSALARRPKWSRLSLRICGYPGMINSIHAFIAASMHCWRLLRLITNTLGTTRRRTRLMAHEDGFVHTQSSGASAMILIED